MSEQNVQGSGKATHAWKTRVTIKVPYEWQYAPAKCIAALNRALISCTKDSGKPERGGKGRQTYEDWPPTDSVRDGRPQKRKETQEDNWHRTVAITKPLASCRELEDEAGKRREREDAHEVRRLRDGNAKVLDESLERRNDGSSGERTCAQRRISYTDGSAARRSDAPIMAWKATWTSKTCLIHELQLYGSCGSSLGCEEEKRAERRKS